LAVGLDRDLSLLHVADDLGDGQVGKQGEYETGEGPA
jgi:hypothetical protein